MALLTEEALRERLKHQDLDAITEYLVEPGTIVTPSAKAFLSDHKIALKTAKAEEGNGNMPTFQKPARYESAHGGWFEEKPEHMTALRGTTLVNKDHPVIRLRGRLDSLEAQVLEAHFQLLHLGRPDAAHDLDEALRYIHEILRCEVLDQSFPDMTLLGMHADELRARSHTPKKFYGMPHFGASPEHGEAVAVLNRLRTEAREVELTAYDAFKNRYGVPSRPDLIQALNRLSSLFYVMMFRVRTNQKGSDA